MKDAPVVNMFSQSVVVGTKPKGVYFNFDLCRSTKLRGQTSLIGEHTFRANYLQCGMWYPRYVNFIIKPLNKLINCKRDGRYSVICSTAVKTCYTMEINYVQVHCLLVLLFQYSYMNK